MPANTAKTRKAKGVRLESEIVALIKEQFGDNYIAKRMPKSGQLKDFKADIYTDLPISIEAKNQETWKPLEWWKQCTRDAKDKIPVLVMSKNRLKSPLALIEFKDLLKLMK